MNHSFSARAFYLIVFFLIALATINSCARPSAIIQTDTMALDKFASSLKVQYTWHENIKDGPCDPKRANGHCYRATLALTPSVDFDREWYLYFSHIQPIQAVLSEAFSVERINGDLHRLAPSAQFSGFVAGQTLEIPLLSDHWMLSKSDLMPNYYLTLPGTAPQLIASTRDILDPATGLEYPEHALNAFATSDTKTLLRNAKDATKSVSSASRFDSLDYGTFPQSALRTRIIPAVGVLQIGSGSLDLSQGVQLSIAGFDQAYLEAALEELFTLGLKKKTGGIPLILKKTTEKQGEAYSLDITEQAILMRAANEDAGSDALRSLAQLLASEPETLPLVKIQDQPRYSFRGLLIDISRNFRNLNYLKKILEQMARYKLNKLHLHMADDEGWRIQIPELPSLTEVGAKRCHDLQDKTCLLPQLGSGPFAKPTKQFLSTEDYKALIKFAALRHIEIIPSIDMPGHSRAAVKSIAAHYRSAESSNALPFLQLLDPMDSTEYQSIQNYSDNTINICLDSARRFATFIFDKIQSLHHQAGVPLKTYHLGADETAGAWLDSPACRAKNNGVPLDKHSSELLLADFLVDIASYIDKAGVQVAAWSDGVEAMLAEPEKRYRAFTQHLQSNAWTPLFWGGHDVAHKQANAGLDVILSIPDSSYFDFPYEANLHEPGYYWAGRATPSKKVFFYMPDNLPLHAEIYVNRDGHHFTSVDEENPLNQGKSFKGIQAQLWSETVRSDARADYMLFPRLLAFAERAWHKADWEVPYLGSPETYSKNSEHFSSEKRKLANRDWQGFAHALGMRELAQLEKHGVNYRLPPVAAKYIDGELHAKAAFPGLQLEYSCRRAGFWCPYLQALPVTDKSELPLLRHVSPNGSRQRYSD